MLAPLDIVGGKFSKAYVRKYYRVGPRELACAFGDAAFDCEE